jgi:glycosyltransferase involved in cell wall biosynthesis
LPLTALRHISAQPKRVGALRVDGASVDVSAPVPADGKGRITALVIAHDARATGGVGNYLRVMRVNYRARVDAFRFANGPRHKGGGKVAKTWRMLRDYLNFAHLLRRRRFDVLHVNPTLDLSSTPRELVFVWLARLFQPRMKRIVFYRGWRHDSFARIARSGLLRRLFLATHRRVDRVLVLSQEFADALAGIGVDRAKLHTTTTMFERGLFRDTVPADPGGRRAVLFLARFIPAKGGAELIEAFARVAPRFPGWTLVMAGGGPDDARLKAVAAASGAGERIVFPGYVGGEAKARLLADCSVFALPTTHPEGMPNAILEAMAAGQAIITTPVGGIRDVVRDGENGTVLDTVTVETVEQALLRYMTDPALLARVGERNREVAWANYESSIVADRMADHYRGALTAA